MKDYTYKVVGVTFEGRQDVLKALYDAARSGPEKKTEFDVVLREDNSRGGVALAVDIGGKHVGFIGKEDKMEVIILEPEASRIFATLSRFKTTYAAKVHIEAPDDVLEKARQRHEESLRQILSEEAPEEPPKKGLFSRFGRKKK